MVLETRTASAQILRNRINYEPTKTANLGDISEISESLIPDAFMRLRAATQPTLAELSEALILWTKEQIGQDQFITALGEFQRQAGTFYFDDPFYHERTNYFLDHFSFQRQMIHNGKAHNNQTPLDAFLASNAIQEMQIPQHINNYFRELADFRHSIFEIAKISPSGCIVRDLITKQRLEINGEGLDAFRLAAKSLVFQAFVFCFDGRRHLSKGIIFHSPAATKHIRAAIKRTIASPDFSEQSLLLLLAKQNLAFTRLKRMDAKTAYAQPK